MITEKKLVPEIKLHTYNEDLTKEWFIFWYEGKNNRIKKYKGINKHETVEGRLAAAKKLKKYWEDQFTNRIEGFKGTTYHEQYKSIQAFMAQMRPTWRKKTIQTHESRLKIFFEWNNLQEITTDRIRAFFAAQAALGKKPNTLSGYFRSFKNILEPALGEELLEGIRVKKVQGTPARYFSEAQIRFLSKEMNLKDPDLWMGVQFIFYCYIRPGELRLLKVGDLILEDKKICIPKEISKNKKTQYVIIPDAFYKQLNEVYTYMNPSFYVLSKSHTPVGTNWLKNRHQKLLRDLHFDTKQHKLYSWKHTGAVMAVKNNVHIKQLQLQLRHHSLDQVNAYLRQMGIMEMGDFASKMPEI